VNACDEQRQLISLTLWAKRQDRDICYRNSINEEAVMELKQCKFYHAGQEMNCAIFANDPCLIRYLQSIPLPIGPTPVDVYEIEPGAKTQWIVVKHVDGNQSALQIFIRDGETFQSIPKSPRRSEEKNRTAVSQNRVCFPVHVGCVKSKRSSLHQTPADEARVCAFI
jgi:hypothetical protein